MPMLGRSGYAHERECQTKIKKWYSRCNPEHGTAHERGEKTRREGVLRHFNGDGGDGVGEFFVFYPLFSQDNHQRGGDGKYGYYQAAPPRQRCQPHAIGDSAAGQ